MANTWVVFILVIFYSIYKMNTLLPRPLVGLVMGSTSDWSVMKYAARLLDNFEIPYDRRVLSAHRMPDKMFSYAENAIDLGLRVIIAGAGGAAHLPGMLASKTTLPVLGVPVGSQYLKGLDSLYSIVQMPRGIPVATFAIGEAGAVNAALFAISVLASSMDSSFVQLSERLKSYRSRQAQEAESAQWPDEK